MAKITKNIFGVKKPRTNGKRRNGRVFKNESTRKYSTGRQRKYHPTQQYGRERSNLRIAIRSDEFERSFQLLSKMAVEKRSDAGDCTYFLGYVLKANRNIITKWNKQNLAVRVIQLYIDNNIEGSNGMMAKYIHIQKDTNKMPPSTVLINKIKKLKIKPTKSLLFLITRTYAKMLSIYMCKENVAHYYATQANIAFEYMVHCLRNDHECPRIQTFLYNTVLEMWYRMYCISNKTIKKQHETHHWIKIRQETLENFWKLYDERKLNVRKDPFTYEAAFRICLLTNDLLRTDMVKSEYALTSFIRFNSTRYNNPMKSIEVLTTLIETSSDEISSEEEMSIYEDGKKSFHHSVCVK